MPENKADQIRIPLKVLTSTLFILICFFMLAAVVAGGPVVPLLQDLTFPLIMLVFQMGDGFSNMIWPTNALLLIGLGLARVTYKDWFKWILPIQLVLMGVCIIFLLIAVSTGYA